MPSTISRIISGFVVLGALPLPACDRPQRSMGRYIESASLILIADARAGSTNDQLVLSVHEFLKGSASRSITIKRPYCPHVPESKGMAVLLTPDWSSTGFPVIEVYTDAGSIARLRELVPIYRLPSERQRLDALKSDVRYRDQLLDDLREMRERGSYSVVTDLYANLDKAGRVKLIELIGYIGDVRGVPLLIQALTADASEVRDAARATLAFYFPGAAGTGAAADSSAASENAMQKAFRLAKEGRWPEARPRLLTVASDDRETEHTRMWAALELIPQLDFQGKSGLRRRLLPLLSRMVRAGNYLQLADAVRILRELRDRENLELLVEAIGRKDFLLQRTPFEAAMGLWELGAPTRAKAVGRLSAMLDNRAKEEGYRTIGGTPPAPLLALAWLGGEPEFQRTRDIRGDYLRAVWGVGLQPNEGAFLAGVLRNPGAVPPEAIEWIAMRLGELKDARAIEPLVGLLGSAQWSVMQSSEEALIRIAGEQVAAAVQRVLESRAAVVAREAALGILHATTGAAALPQIRAALAEKPLRTAALGLLARAGTEEDLKILIPMSDFWTGDREAHYWAIQAVGEIRARYRGLR
jgi:HEAT repeat protein